MSLNCTWLIFHLCTLSLYVSNSCIWSHLQKAEDMNHSITLPDLQKHNISHFTEELKNQKADSSNLRMTTSYRMDREPSVVVRLNQFDLQKSTVEQEPYERGK